MSATSLDSVKEAIASLRKYLKQVERAPAAVLTKEATRIKREAKSETPRKSGKLERSVSTQVSKAKSGATITISASASSKSGYDYSEIQHENRKFKHRKGKSHYLIDPYNRGVARIKRQLDQELQLPKGGRKK